MEFPDCITRLVFAEMIKYYSDCLKQTLAVLSILTAVDSLVLVDAHHKVLYLNCVFGTSVV